jgi:hypothetical protein
VYKRARGTPVLFRASLSTSRAQSSGESDPEFVPELLLVDALLADALVLVAFVLDPELTSGATDSTLESVILERPCRLLTAERGDRVVLCGPSPPSRAVHSGRWLVIKVASITF